MPAWARGGNTADVGDVLTLKRAVSTASADIDVINITKDITHDELLGIPRSVTINLNGNTLTAKRIARTTDGGFLTVRNGKLNSSLASDVDCTLTLEDAEVTADPYDVPGPHDDGSGGALFWVGKIVLKNSRMTVNAGTISDPMNVWGVPATGDMLDIDDGSRLRIKTVDISQMQIPEYDGMWILLRSNAEGDKDKENDALTAEYWARLGKFFPNGYALYVESLGKDGVLLLVKPEEGKDPTSVTLAKRYAVTVENGTGGGSYEAGATVTVKANAAPTGQEFVKWTSGDGVKFADAAKTTTTFTMLAKAVAVTANYKTTTTPKPSPAPDYDDDPTPAPNPKPTPTPAPTPEPTPTPEPDKTDEEKAEENKRQEEADADREAESGTVEDTRTPAGTDLIENSDTASDALKKANEELSVQPKTVTSEAANREETEKLSESLSNLDESKVEDKAVNLDAVKAAAGNMKSAEDIEIETADGNLDKQAERVEEVFNGVAANLPNVTNAGGGKGVVIASVLPKMTPKVTGFFPLKVNLRNLTPGRRLMFWPSVAYFNARASGSVSVAATEGDAFFLDENGKPTTVVTGDAAKMTVVPYLVAGTSYETAFITVDATAEDLTALETLAEETRGDAKKSSGSSGCDAGLGCAALLALASLTTVLRKRSA